MVDAKDRRFVEDAVDDLVQLARRLEVAPERLLDDDAGVACAARLREILDDRCEGARRNREVVCRTLGAAELLHDRGIRRAVAVVAVDVAQARRELRERHLVDPAVVLETLSCACPQLFEGPAGFGDADHRHVETAAPGHRLQGGKNLLVCEIAGRAEEDERVGEDGAHVRAHVPGAFSW